MDKVRSEHDSFGAIEVPATALWGAQTQRSLLHFHISTEKMPVEFIEALAYVKKACIAVNGRAGRLPAHKVDTLLAAVNEVLRGEHSSEFPLSIWQTGSATQTNMNMNEVLANRAVQLLGGVLGLDHYIHPNDDVNLGQSSNDVIPTAIHVAVVCQLHQYLLPSLRELIHDLSEKEQHFSSVIKVGRTHLQDAVPITLGQEFSGYVQQLEIAIGAIDLAMPGLYELAIGGSAVGTGINAPRHYGEHVSAELKHLLGFPFVSAPNKFSALAGCEALVFAHGALKLLATALMKISTDIRWMSSGPRSGLGEIFIPENEPGSSIMPGKVNPTQCEVLAMICYQVLGNDMVIGLSAASGNFELNVFRPVILHNFLQSIRLLSDGITSFSRYCIQGIEPNLPRIDRLMRDSLMLVTALNPYIGYDKAASIAKQAYEKNISLREATIASGFLSSEEFDLWVDPSKLI
ncbi:class II fumarate hydratase [Polynucleobacter sp. AP-Nino-20-G2]|uniref:class II fumarate hydratase n=1 Tax=Polynucleobacter sp. AP-Nino-20-G2 TaxID=2576917 RepID=UPI001BFE067D|nr:class II fumarate hydratase [Polynucleobacter sp. AP-Nino-20-G2]QWE17235.1 class II fumarate hydratase [Polynucleobacter sp. AP-Nino-20-G2]